MFGVEVWSLEVVDEPAAAGIGGGSSHDFERCVEPEDTYEERFGFRA